MALNTTLTVQGETAVIALDGDLDATTAPIFEADIEKAAQGNPQRLILDMTKLSYLSSAGLRQLVYARQKMDDGVRVILVGANDRVTQTIKLVGFDQSVTFSERMPQ